MSNNNSNNNNDHRINRVVHHRIPLGLPQIWTVSKMHKLQIFCYKCIIHTFYADGEISFIKSRTFCRNSCGFTFAFSRYIYMTDVFRRNCQLVPRHSLISMSKVSAKQFPSSSFLSKCIAFQKQNQRVSQQNAEGTEIYFQQYSEPIKENTKLRTLKGDITYPTGHPVRITD